MLFLFVPVLALLAQPRLETAQKEVVLRTRYVSGTFLGFETGDYVHAIVKTGKSKERSFFIGGAGVDYFLATHVGERGTFTYEVVDSHIPEAGGRMRTERLVRAKFGSASSTSWWKRQTAAKPLEDLEKEYQPLVQKATRGG